MSKSKEISKMTNSKSTKSELQTALNEAIKAVKDMELVRFNPKEEAEKIKVEKVISNVEKELNQQVTNRNSLTCLNAAMNSIDSIVTQLKTDYEESKNGIEESQKEYKEIKEAIKIQEQKLKDLFGIEETLVKLSDLISYHNNREVELDIRYNQMTIDAENKLSEHKAKIKQDIEDLKQSYSRKAEEFEYDFEREKKIRQDETDDLFAAKKKELLLHEQQVNKSLSDRQDEFVKSKEEFFKEKRTIENYEAEIEELRNDRDEDIQAAKEEAKAKAKKSFDYEVRYIKKDLETKLDIANNKIETLENNVSEKGETIIELQEKLEAAYNKLESLANKSMETSANKDTIASLQSLIEKQNKNSDK